MSAAPIVGVLLAGGLGRRIGGDKALLALAGQPLVARAAASLAPQVGRLIVNANGDVQRLAFLDLPVVPDESGDFPGPLAGVMAGLRWMAREVPRSAFLASLPVDVPFAPPDLVARLAASLADNPAAGVAVAQSRGRRHHVIGLWRPSAAREIEAALARGERKVEAIVDRLGGVAVPFDDLEIGGAPADPFFNVNTPEDLALAEEMLAGATSPEKNEGKPFVVGVAGWKNSGKTTLVAKLIGALTARGFRVSTIKHSHHDLALDDAGTDSARHRAAGAQEVAVVSPMRWLLGDAVHDEPEPPLADVLARLAPADIVLVEGYKGERIAKIEVRRRGQGDGPPLAETDARVLAIASDHAVGDATVPVLDLDDVDGIAGALLAAAGLSLRKDKPVRR